MIKINLHLITALLATSTLITTIKAHAQPSDGETPTIRFLIKNDYFKKPEIIQSYLKVIDLDFFAKCHHVTQVAIINIDSIKDDKRRKDIKTMWIAMDEAMKIAKSKFISQGQPSKKIDQMSNIYREQYFNLQQSGNVSSANSMITYCKNIIDTLAIENLK
jgi:hypothetical protein